MVWKVRSRLQQAIIKGNAEPQKLVKAIMEAGYYAEIAIQ